MRHLHLRSTGDIRARYLPGLGFPGCMEPDLSDQAKDLTVASSQS